MALESGIAQLVEAFIAAGRPSSREQNIDDRRAGYIASTALAGETETRLLVEDIELDNMTFRVVSPLNATGSLPCVIYYHGGCFVSGGFATHDNPLRQLALYSGCRVIAVQYRLAPEHTYPAAHDDAERGANIIWKYAEKLGIDRERITLAGDSAGGHLALTSALRLKATEQWQPARLILIYPMLDATASLRATPVMGRITSSHVTHCCPATRCICRIPTLSTRKPARYGGTISAGYHPHTLSPLNSTHCAMRVKRYINGSWNKAWSAPVSAIWVSSMDFSNWQVSVLRHEVPCGISPGVLPYTNEAQAEGMMSRAGPPTLPRCHPLHTGQTASRVTQYMCLQTPRPPCHRQKARPAFEHAPYDLSPDGRDRRSVNPDQR